MIFEDLGEVLDPKKLKRIDFLDLLNKFECSGLATKPCFNFNWHMSIDVALAISSLVYFLTFDTLA